MVPWLKMSTYNVYNTSKVNKVVSRELEQNLHDYYQVAEPRTEITVSHDQKHDVMPPESNEHSEAYYLYFIAISGMLLNIFVVGAIFVRKPLRKMTSGFMIHACFLDFTKSAYCIPIATNLLSQSRPTDCNFFGATYVILITISVFNMVAMVCTEAYTFGEKNIGGNSKGTVICVTFGVVLVYIGSIILHLGPTLIGGHFEFQPEIGSCSFTFGKQTGYVANVMWAVITTVAMVAVFHFIHRLYKEIQINRPNRVSFLVRTSITVLDTATSSACRLRKIIRDATHRAKIFILNTIVFILCWYPFFLLIIVDKNFKVPPKVYQAFAFIAWSHGAIQPILYILFDRNLNILSKYVYCDKHDFNNIIQNMMHHQRNLDHSNARHRSSAADSDTLAPSPSRNNSDNRRTNLVDIIREHQEMCVVQNSSNQNVHNRVNNSNVSVEILDLTNQINPCSNIPPDDPPYPEQIDYNEEFNNTVENPTYINRVESEGFSPRINEEYMFDQQHVIFANEDYIDNNDGNLNEVQF